MDLSGRSEGRGVRLDHDRVAAEEGGDLGGRGGPGGPDHHGGVGHRHVRLQEEAEAGQVRVHCLVSASRSLTDQPKKRRSIFYPYTDYTNYTDYTPYTRYTTNSGKSREIES